MGNIFIFSRAETKEKARRNVGGKLFGIRKKLRLEFKSVESSHNFKMKKSFKTGW